MDKPFEAIKELHRILSKDGHLAFYVPWIYPHHNAPLDYFRFSQEGIQSLTDIFTSIEITPCDFQGLKPNRIYCALSFLLPAIDLLQWLVYRLIGYPVYLLYRVLLYMGLYFKHRKLRNLSEEIDKRLVYNCTHGYWCLCCK